MALIKCPDCGKSVSSEAGECPECGHPIREKRKAKSRRISTPSACFIILIALGFIIWLAGRDSGRPATTSPDSQKPAARPTQSTQKKEGTRKPLPKDEKPAAKIEVPPLDPEKALTQAKTALEKAWLETRKKLGARPEYEKAKADLESARARMVEARKIGSEAELATASQDYFAASKRVSEMTKEAAANSPEIQAAEKELARAENELSHTLTERKRTAHAEAEAARRAEEEYDARGLVLLLKTVQGKRGEFGGEITGTVVNRRGVTLSYAQITFILYDGSGAQVGTALANINDLESGGRWNFTATTFGTDFVHYKFSELSGF